MATTVRREAAGRLRDRAAGGDRCRITVRHGDAPEQHFEIRRHELLLKAAIEHGIDYPHNCRVGVCGRCRTRIVRGKVSPMVDLALSPLDNDEIRAGTVLACQAKVRGDLVIDVRLGHGAQLPVRTVSARVSHWQRLPGEVIDLRLALDEPLVFRAGQYATIAESGSFTRRSFSFREAPPADGSAAHEVGFLVKRLPGGRFSEWLYAEDRRGTKFWLEGPFGLMGVAAHDSDALCVAGGTGIAPILAIVGDRLRRSPTTRFTIVHGLRSAAERYAEPALAALQAEAGARLRVLTILSHEPADSGWRGLRGLVTEALTPTLGIDYATTAAFVCGNLAMVEAVERRLRQLGVAPGRIHADKFVPSGTP